METQKANTIIKNAVDNGIRHFNIVFNDGIKAKKRIGITANGEYLLMRTSMRGEYLTSYVLDGIKEIYPVNKVNPAIAWEKQIKKLIDILEKSGLWPNLLNDAKQAINIGYENIQKATQLQYLECVGDYATKEKIRTEKIKALNPALVKQRDDGTDYINSDIIWYLANIKIKKMNFGYDNAAILKNISECIDKKTVCHESGKASYDVSFEYNPDKNMAWYSEEYKNCGNGHYYLALNKTHAIFWEDD